MTSSERKELRYKRRKEKREKKNNRRCELYSDINNAFRFSKVMHYADKCCNGVGWKKSTKSFMLHEFAIIANTCYNIKNDCYKVGKIYKFMINERGKVRDIDAYADAIIKMIKTYDKYNKKEIRKYVVNKYDKEIVCKNIINILEKCIK